METGWWHDPDALREVIQGLGPWGPVAAFAVLVLEAVAAPLPGWPVVVVLGAVYGPVVGFGLSWLGGVAGSVLAFLLGRRLLRPWIWRRLTEEQRELVARLTYENGFALLVIARWLPVTSLDVLAYVASVSPISWQTYTLAAALGYLPGTLLFTLLGYGLTVAHAEWWLLALGGTAALGWWLARRRRRRSDP